MDASLSVDTIVVGAGTAGCLLANRLSADPQHRVLLIEAGGTDSYPWVHIPVGYLYCIGNPRTDWLFQTEPDPGLNGRRLRYPRGKVLGGCSSINGMIYMRGQARDYDQWARWLGDEAWDWAHCLPDFLLHEDHHGGATTLHGAKGQLPRRLAECDSAYCRQLRAAHAGGEWRVERQRLRWDILDAFARAAVQAGIPPTVDFNRGSNEGVGYFEVNQRAGWRWNAAKAFLRPQTLRRPNLTLWTHAQVSRLRTERREDGGLRCVGVEVWTPQGMVAVHAVRQVVLAAGAIGSPHILQLSGIGPAAWLRQVGVDVVADLPGVGANLQDHLQIRTIYRVSGARTLNTLANRWWGKLQIGLQYLLTRSGPMSMAPSQLGAFTRSDPSQAWPNIEYHVQPLSLDAFGQPLHPFAAITASVCNLNPTSRGNVRLRSPDFRQGPAIAPNYLCTPEDQRVAVDSLRLTRRIMAQPALAPYQPQEHKPGPQSQSDADLLKAAADLGTTIFHPVGTTAMGPDRDPMAVLDARFRVRDGRGGRIERLRVVDAGAMPTITSGNTNSPTLMMAEKAARWMAEGDDVA